MSTAAATVRVMSPEEIAARAGGDVPDFLWPDASTVFAQRAMRLRQLAGGHVMADYLRFAADLAQAQQTVANEFPALSLPGAEELAGCVRERMPPLAADGPRVPGWRDALRALVSALQPARAQWPDAAVATLERLAAIDDADLERQADLLLLGGGRGLDLGTAPLVGAALQVVWTLQVARVRARHRGPGEAFVLLDDPGLCPCCGSRPTASITRMEGSLLGQRYVHCALCSTQWHLPRIQCTHCQGTTRLSYASLEAAGEDDHGARAAQAAVQAEVCGGCHHYLKIVHAERDPFVEPVADDLASLPLDMLVAEAGERRHGVNFLLLVGEPPPDTA